MSRIILILFFMKKIFKVSLILFISFLFTDCASIVSKSKWPLEINTTPSGAKISITNRTGENVYEGKSPATVTLKSGSEFFKKESYVVKLSLDGYADKTINVTCDVNGWYFGNIVFGGIIGFLIIDPATGAMYKLDREKINESLIPSTASTDTPTLHIVDISSIPDELKNHLVLIQ